MRAFLPAGCLGTLLLLIGCGDAPPEAAQARTPVEAAAPTLPPAFILPAEDTEAEGPASYEVGIATAASDRNRAKEECVEMATRARATCEAEADATFESAQSALEDLRGIQQ